MNSMQDNSEKQLNSTISDKQSASEKQMDSKSDCINVSAKIYQGELYSSDSRGGKMEDFVPDIDYIPRQVGIDGYVNTQRNFPGVFKEML